LLQSEPESVHSVTETNPAFYPRSPEPAHDPAPAGKHIPTEREQAFLDTVEETRYEREIINGLAPFFNEKAPEDMLTFYNEGEVTSSRC
jgi:hypothetical protein